MIVYTYHLHFCKKKIFFLFIHETFLEKEFCAPIEPNLIYLSLLIECSINKKTLIEVLSNNGSPGCYSNATNIAMATLSVQIITLTKLSSFRHTHFIMNSE